MIRTPLASMRLRGTWAVVPARSFASGKSRLAVAARGRRDEVARALFDRVVAVTMRAAAIDGVLVATDGDDVVTAAREHGAMALRDAPTGPFASIIDRALAILAGRGATAAVVVMADLPLLGPRHVDDVCSALDDADLVLAPDRDQLGTNALALRLPASTPTRFGHRDSFDRHVVAAAAANLRVNVVRAHGLAFDLDTPADLDELLAAAPQPLEAKPLVTGEGSVRTERRRRITDTIQRIAFAVAQGPVERGALGSDATCIPCDAP
jgi:2-phospho-L-lactate/phosphoenolpyruvate guanylyltransferase